jgi:hypothetical protein
MSRRAAARRRRGGAAAEDEGGGSDSDEEDGSEEGAPRALFRVLRARDVAVRPDLTSVRFPGAQPKTRRERRAATLRRARLARRGAGGGAEVVRQPNSRGVDITLGSWEQLLGSFKTQVEGMQARGGGAAPAADDAAPEAPPASAAAAAGASAGAACAPGGDDPGGAPAAAADAAPDPALDELPAAYRLLLEQRSHAVVQQLRAVLARAPWEGGGGAGAGAAAGPVVAVVPRPLLPFVEREWVRAAGGSGGGGGYPTAAQQ